MAIYNQEWDDFFQQDNITIASVQVGEGLVRGASQWVDNPQHVSLL